MKIVRHSMFVLGAHNNGIKFEFYNAGCGCVGGAMHLMERLSVVQVRLVVLFYEIHVATKLGQISCNRW